MKISVITACYNRATTIQSAIDSLRAQTYRNIEYIVVDGASNDGTVDILKKNTDAIDVLISEPDSGMYNAINKGIKKASGDIVGVLHSDDFYYDDETLAKIAEVFRETNADLVYANGIYVDENNLSKVRRIYGSSLFRPLRLYFGWIPLHTTIYVKRNVFEKYGLYREEFKIASDYDISLRWFQNRNIKKVFYDDYVVKMRIGGKSTDLSQQGKKSSEDLKIIKDHKLLGYFTLFFKILRKVPQYLLPKFFHQQFAQKI